MARKKKLTLDEYKALLPRILAAAEAPVAVMEFDIGELDFSPVDDSLNDLSAHVAWPSSGTVAAADPGRPSMPLSLYETHPVLVVSWAGMERAARSLHTADIHFELNEATDTRHTVQNH